MSPLSRPPARAWAEIDLAAVARNLRGFRRRVGARVKVCAVVKADAYGHGAAAVARRLVSGRGGADMLGVADAREAAELRRAGIRSPILVLGILTPDEFPDAVRLGLTVTVHTSDDVDRLAAAAARARRRTAVHVKVDTGMGRLGVPPAVAWPLVERIRASRALRFEGLFTHFSSAGSLHAEAVRQQMKAFRTAIEEVTAGGRTPALLHAANGAAALAFPETRFHLVRPGLALYGIDPGCCARLGWRPEPALALRSRIAFVKPLAKGRPVGYERRWRAPRDTRIATVPIGHADGLPCALANAGEALVRGRRVPIVGSVTMDYVMLDVGAVRGAREGDAVTFIGADGRERIRVEEMAEKAGTIPYEIVCRIGRRVARLYR